MNRWAVFSDTHGDLSLLPLALSKMGPLDGFFHLGDLSSDADRISRATGLPFYAVRGNCDWSRRYPPEAVVQIEEIRFFLCHGHTFDDTRSFVTRAEDERCDLAMSGHTHIPLFTAQGTLLILNPGSLSRPRFGSPHSCAFIEVDGKELHVKMVPLDLSVQNNA